MRSVLLSRKKPMEDYRMSWDLPAILNGRGMEINSMRSHGWSRRENARKLPERSDK